MTVSDMIAEAAKPKRRSSIFYWRLFAWLPIHTADAGWVWFKHVWKVEAEDGVFYSRDILPFGWRV